MAARSALFLAFVGCSFDVDPEGTHGAECSDRIDNDGNAKVDCDDPACECGADADADTDTDLGTCDGTYGDAPGYRPCGATAAGCRFAADTRTSTCAQICQSAGGSCVEAFEIGAFTCDEGAAATCDTDTVDTLLCTCSR